MTLSKKKVLLIVLASVIVFVLSLSTVTVYSYAMFKADKKAIIILPGLFASGLYDAETGEGVWDPFEGMNLSFGDFMTETGEINFETIVPLLSENTVWAELGHILANNSQGNDKSVLNLMAMNNDGSPVVPSVQRVPWTSESRLKYGVINAQKEMYDSISQNYSKEYTVEIFNYDFRLDNRANAVLLEDYINQQGFTDVVLVSHSNGGQVAAIYLARSQANRDKVSKYISYNSPYYGSFSAIEILENVNGMVSGITEMMNQYSLTFLSSKIELVFENQFMKLLNMWPVYQLLPSFELLTTKYGEEEAGYYLDGQKIVFETEEDLWDFYCSRPWAKLAGGELRKQMEQWIDYKNSMKVTLASGEKVFSTTLIDTVYFSGDNVLSTDKVYFTTNTDETITLTSSSSTMRGDGIVLLSSAAAMETSSERIVLVDGVDHYGVNINFFGCAETQTNLAMKNHIESTQKWYTKLWKGVLK